MTPRERLAQAIAGTMTMDLSDCATALFELRDAWAAFEADEYIGPVCGKGEPFCQVVTPIGELRDESGRPISAEDEAKIRHECPRCPRRGGIVSPAPALAAQWCEMVETIVDADRGDHDEII